MEIQEYLRKRGYKIIFSKDNVTATKNNDVYEAKNLTFLLNNIVNKKKVIEETQDEKLSDPFKLEEYFSNKNKS